MRKKIFATGELAKELQKEAIEELDLYGIDFITTNKKKQPRRKIQNEQLLDAGERRRLTVGGFYDALAAYRHFLLHVYPSAAAQGERAP